MIESSQQVMGSFIGDLGVYSWYFNRHHSTRYRLADIFLWFHGHVPCQSDIRNEN